MTLGTVFRASHGASLMVGGVRLPSTTLQALRSAEEIVREAQSAAEGLRAQAAQDAATLKAQARSEGFAQGRLEAVGQLIGTVQLERHLRELLAEQLADVVERCVRSLLGEVGEPEVLRRRVLHLLHCGGSDDGVASPALLYAAPADVDQLRAALAAQSEPLSALTIVPDERRTSGSLLLEMRGGFVESNLELTIDQVREVVRRAAEHATRQLEQTT